MYHDLYQRYLAQTYELEVQFEELGQIKQGQLKNEKGSFPIQNFIPRFVGTSNYADSFGFQWNTFKSTQLDSQNGRSLSKDRFYRFTKWKPEDLKGKEVLEVGCGAGRFSEILLAAGANLVSVDYSSAVDACFNNNKNKKFLALQGDLFALPLKKKSFDFVFCYGVLQHTPDPIAGFKELTTYLKPGAKISIDNYVNRIFSPFCTPKYLWRPLTSRMNRETLLKIIRAYIPIYLPFDTLIRKIPKVGPRILAMIPIPCWNYIELGLSPAQRKEWAILDTFDALATKYDFPKDIKDYEKVSRELKLEKSDIFYGSTGLVVNAQAPL